MFIAGAVLVLLGTALEVSARRRKLQTLTVQPIQPVGIADIMREVARLRHAAAASEPARLSELASAQSHPRLRDTCLWRYRVW
jgi:hypothetical protein